MICCSHSNQLDIGATIAGVPSNTVSRSLVITHLVREAVNGVDGTSITNGVNGKH